MKLYVTTDIVKRYARQGATPVERKRRMDVLCFAIWCKMQHSNSIIYGLGVRQIMSALKVGYGRASNLLKSVREDKDLFEDKGDGKFLVKSFRDKTRKYTKKGFVYQGASVFAFDVNKDYTLKDIYDRLNELLFLRPIGSEESNRSHVSGSKNSLCRSAFITMKEFVSEVGMSQASVSAIKKRLVENSEITSTCAEVHVADARNEEEVKNLLTKYGRRTFTYTKGDRKYIVIPCRYAITCRKDKAACGRHKIYGYKKRMTGKAEQLATIANMPD